MKLHPLDGAAQDEPTTGLVCGIDPGPQQSALVLWDGQRIHRHGILPNEELILSLPRADVLVIEMVSNMGAVVGAEVFDTLRWIGKFEREWERFGGEVALIRRCDVKLHFCGTMRSKDSNVRAALIEQYGPIGTAKQKGPLHGVVSHEWQALAVAACYVETRGGDAG